MSGIHGSRVSEAGSSSGSGSVAQSLRQATQLLLQAAVRLDLAGPSHAGSSSGSRSGSGSVTERPATERPALHQLGNNQIFRLRVVSGRQGRQRSVSYERERKWNHAFACLKYHNVNLPTRRIVCASFKLHLEKRRLHADLTLAQKNFMSNFFAPSTD